MRVQKINRIKQKENIKMLVAGTGAALTFILYLEYMPQLVHILLNCK